VIKTCATGGVLSLTDDVDTPQLTQAELDAMAMKRTHCAARRPPTRTEHRRPETPYTRTNRNSICIRQSNKFLFNPIRAKAAALGSSPSPRTSAGRVHTFQSSTRFSDATANRCPWSNKLSMAADAEP